MGSFTVHFTAQRTIRSPGNIYVCLSVYLLVSSVYLGIYISVRPSIHPSIYPAFLLVSNIHVMVKGNYVVSSKNLLLKVWFCVKG
jgi:hypothetical protein